MSKKIHLHITDERMLKLPEILKWDRRIRYVKEFCDRIEVPKQLPRQVKIGKQHFTAAHIARACKEFGINANFIMGIEENIYLTGKIVTIKSITLRKKTAQN